MNKMTNKQKILITGGAGYIGSHTCVVLLEAGFDVAVVDNLCNSSREALRRVESITGKSISFHEADIRDGVALAKIFEAEKPQAVIHFAGLKAVGESVEKPLEYYDNNVGGTLTLLLAMRTTGVRQIVFSSSATVYGNPATVPIREDFPLSATNPYGRSKLIIEDILRDLVLSDASWKAALLRYFNPVGAHESGLIGEDPNGIPNNLMPFVSQVAVGRRPHLNVYGGDYPTPDGTGVRDYIHVVDLAKGHLAALQALNGWQGNQPLTVNLGTGHGYSVLDMVRAFEKVSGHAVPYQIVDRRPGDIATCYADPVLAERLLGWKAQFGVERMCEDAWRWQVENPDGYTC
jgi:UDP-glucose 4-epimerase